MQSAVTDWPVTKGWRPGVKSPPCNSSVSRLWASPAGSVCVFGGAEKLCRLGVSAGTASVNLAAVKYD